MPCPCSGQGAACMQKRTINIVAAIIMGLIALGLYVVALMTLTSQ